jgi:hypothetical protein
MKKNKTNLRNSVAVASAMSREQEINVADRFLLTSLTSVGYDAYTAIAEIVDNSVDAKADLIFINYDPKTATLTILDNGTGMSTMRSIASMDMGADREYADNEIGYFGAGMKTSLLNLVDLSDINSSVVIDTNDGSESTRITWNPAKSVRKYTIDQIKKDVIERGTRTQINGVKKFQIASLKRNLGVFFYPVLNTDSVKIIINGEHLIGNDPLYRHSEKTKSNYVEATVEGHTIRIEASVLHPEENRHSWEQKDKGGDDLSWSLRKGGLYVVYGGRYIEYGGSLNAFANHPTMNWVRIEFTIPKELTEVFNIKFNKTNGLDLDPKKDANEVLSDLIRKVRDLNTWGVRNRENKTVTTKVEETELHDLQDQLNNAAKKARVKKPVTDTPKPEGEPDQPDPKQPEAKQPEAKQPETDQPEPTEATQPKPRIAKYEPFKIKHMNMYNTGVFWHLGHENNQFVITLNEGHVFYMEMWRNMNESAKSSMMFLLASIAKAQYESDGSVELWDNFWGNASTTLRHLHGNK